MTEAELDEVYTHLCKTMTTVGEARSPLFLARFALLAINALGDPARALALIEEAGRLEAPSVAQTTV